ncbi:hypothetical protein HYY75_07645 [bacterium]|nr:hypothetical protein [bacterium]
MKIKHWLWLLWGALVISMVLKRELDTYAIVTLIMVPILIEFLELHEEVGGVREEVKVQRKFILDRYALLTERISDLSSQFEKKMVVDFAEFAKNNPPSTPSLENLDFLRRKKKKKKKFPEPPTSESSAISVAQPEQSSLKGEEDLPKEGLSLTSVEKTDKVSPPSELPKT